MIFYYVAILSVVLKFIIEEVLGRKHTYLMDSRFQLKCFLEYVQIGKFEIYNLKGFSFQVRWIIYATLTKRLRGQIN